MLLKKMFYPNLIINTGITNFYPTYTTKIEKNFEMCNKCVHWCTEHIIFISLQGHSVEIFFFYSLKHCIYVNKRNNYLSRRY